MEKIKWKRWKLFKRKISRLFYWYYSRKEKKDYEFLKTFLNSEYLGLILHINLIKGKLSLSDNIYGSMVSKRSRKCFFEIECPEGYFPVRFRKYFVFCILADNFKKYIDSLGDRYLFKVGILFDSNIYRITLK
ncbi:MAG: hypothetical protein ACFFDB_00380 [Promethearchaeota archaeon]